MVKAYLDGKTAPRIRETTKMTKSTDLENISTKKAEAFRDSGDKV
jgi:hypothetical protein